MKQKTISTVDKHVLVNFAVDSAWLERRALLEAIEELLEGSTGQRQGDPHGKHPADVPRAHGRGAGGHPRRHDHVGSPPRRQREDREGVRCLGQGSWILWIQSHLRLRQLLGDWALQINEVYMVEMFVAWLLIEFICVWCLFESVVACTIF